MALVNLDKLRSDIETEHEKIDIKAAAKNLRGLKQLMGPVTSVWSDFILESAMNSGLSKEEIVLLVQEMEADIRRAVKKDKSQIVYGAIVAFAALNQTQLYDFASIYSDMLGLNFRKFISHLLSLSNTGTKVIRGFQIVYLKDPVLGPIMAKLIPVNQTNTFQRASKRTVKFITGKLHRYKTLFRRIIGGDSYDIGE